MPFQIDITKDHAEAFVYLSFPTAMTTYLVTAYVNNQGLNPLIVTPVAGNTLEPYVINYDLTKATSTGLGSPNPRKLIQDFWIRIEETPNYRAQGSLLPSTQSVSGPSAVVEPSLNGLPTSVGSGNPVGLDVSCVSRGQKVLVKMFVQVAGDLRLAGDAP